ncbi:unnamed protein product [Scytosiphon promiscuus]
MSISRELDCDEVTVEHSSVCQQHPNQPARKCIGCDFAPICGLCSPPLDGQHFCGSDARSCRFKGMWDAVAKRWRLSPARENSVLQGSDLSSWLKTPSTSAASPLPAAAPPISASPATPAPLATSTARPSAAVASAARTIALIPDGERQKKGPAPPSSAGPAPKKARNDTKSINIGNKEDAEAWVAKQAAAQIRDGLRCTYSSLVVVEEGGKVLLRCPTCFEAEPTKGGAIVKGVDVCGPNFQSHIIARHFEKKGSKPSQHEVGQQKLRDRKTFEESLKESPSQAREPIVTCLRLIAHLAQQESPLSQFSSLAATVRCCGGNMFATPAYETYYGAGELLEALSEVTNNNFHVKLEKSAVVGLQVDESTDNSDSSNILMFVTYEEDFYPGVAMLALKPVLSVDSDTQTIMRATGKNIAEIIKTTIEATPGLSSAKVMGLATDGAAAMIGVRGGAAAFLKQQNPSMVTVHCIAHKENLAATAACSSETLTTETDTLLTDASGYMSKSSLRQLGFRLTQIDKGDARPSGLKSLHKIRFLSRGLAVAAIVKNYVPLLTFLKAEAGQLAVAANNTRLQKAEDALQRDAASARATADILRTQYAALNASKLSVVQDLGPDLSDEQRLQRDAILQPATEAMQRIQEQLFPLVQKEARCQREIAASRLLRENASSTEKGTAAAASLFERMSSFRMMGMMFVLQDFLGILNELNRLFQFRLLTYKGIMADVHRAGRKLRRQFLGENGVQAHSFRTLLAELGGSGGEPAFREQLRQHPDGFLTKYKNSEELISVKMADVNEVENAAKGLAQTAVDQLEIRFEKLPLLENFWIFDPQLFPTEEDVLLDFGNTEMNELAKHFGKQHVGIAPCVDPEKVTEEWNDVKDIMYDVRRSPDMKSKIAALRATEKKANEGEACGEEDDEEETDPDLERPLLKKEKLRKELSQRFISLFAEFWREVQSSRGGGKFSNVFKLVKIYIVQPHSSIECERGFSAQNRIKRNDRNRMAVSRLEALMRLSLSYRQQRIDLTTLRSTPILEKAAVLFDKSKKRR